MTKSRLKDFLAEIDAENVTGTYVGMNVSDKSKKEIKSIIEKYEIPNPIDVEKLHVTVVYSRRVLKDFDAKGELDEPIRAKVVGIKRLKGSEESSEALVIELKSKELTARHKHIRKKYKATHDYDDYIVHVTLSYDIDDKNYDDIASEIKEIEFDNEYKQKLDLNWASKNKG